MDRRVGIAAIRTLAGAALMYGVTELMRPAQVSATPNTSSEYTRAVGMENFFGAIGDRLNVSSKVWECLSEIGIKWHDRKGVGTVDLTGAAVTLYNSSNSGERVTLQPQSSIPYDRNGYAGYARNGKNLLTGEGFALLRGDRLCGDPCQTEISVYESTAEGQPLGPVTKQVVDCPSTTRCVTNIHWNDESRRSQLPPVESTPPSTSTLKPPPALTSTIIPQPAQVPSVTPRGGF